MCSINLFQKQFYHPFVLYIHIYLTGKGLVNNSIHYQKNVWKQLLNWMDYRVRSKFIPELILQLANMLYTGYVCVCVCVCYWIFFFTCHLFDSNYLNLKVWALQIAMWISQCLFFFPSVLDAVTVQRWMIGT